MQIIIFLLYAIGILSMSLIVIKIADQIKKNRLSNSSKKDNPISSSTTHVPTKTYASTTHSPTTTNQPTTTNKPTTTKQPIKYYENHTLIETSVKNAGGIINHNVIDDYHKCITEGPLVEIKDINDNISYYCPGIPTCYPNNTLLSTSSVSGINIVNPIDDYNKCCNTDDPLVTQNIRGTIYTYCPSQNQKYACDAYYSCVKYPSTPGITTNNHGIFDSIDECNKNCHQPF